MTLRLHCYLVLHCCSVLENFLLPLFLSSFEIEGKGKGWGYLTFLMAMMKKQPMMAKAMAVGKAKL